MAKKSLKCKIESNKPNKIFIMVAILLHDMAFILCIFMLNICTDVYMIFEKSEKHFKGAPVKTLGPWLDADPNIFIKCGH